ncbi:MAG: glycosyltransferase [Actinomycetota bacterium]|nr:glycosyltransferase [Actinomycetota bacterium]
MAPKRVAHVISTRGVGGAERFLNALLKEGASRQWDQIVLNPFANAGSEEFAELIHPIPWEGFPCDRARQLPFLLRRIKRRLTDFDPQVIHVLLFQAMLAVAAIPMQKHTVLVATNVYGEGVRVLSRPMLRQVLDRWAGLRYERLVAISEAVERFLVCEYRYPASKVTCIPLGWEGRPLPAEEGDRPPTVVCVAKLRPEKGHTLLLSAFQRVAASLPDARLVLVGDGEAREQIAEHVTTLGLGGHVEITGRVPEVWPYLARADVFALASTTEAYGIAVAEAMAAGLPVVASAVGGVPELVRPGVTGELFPPGDEQALAAHLLRLLTSPHARRRMSAAAREAARPLSMQGSASRYADLIEHLGNAVHAQMPDTTAAAKRPAPK